jgi:outer membrane murein-binding lipoprotein Lpp
VVAGVNAGHARKNETEVSDKDGQISVAGQRQARNRLSQAALIRYDPHRHRAERKDRRRRASAQAACNVPCNLVEKNLMTKILKVGVAAAVLALGAGCTDLKPLQAEVDSLKSQVSKLSSDVEGVKTSADGASRAAAAAQQAATSAQNTANQAASAAQAAQQCCDANSEKLNRMFEKSMSK